jgi:hypothetical protein
MSWEQQAKGAKDEGRASVTCPVCGAAMGVFESIDHLDGTSSWSGICAGYGTQVEGERPERMIFQG